MDPVELELSRELPVEKLLMLVIRGRLRGGVGGRGPISSSSKSARISQSRYKGSPRWCKTSFRALLLAVICFM
jgi:hypothetical protein